MKTTSELKQEELLETKKLKQEIVLCGIITVLLVSSLFFHPLALVAFFLSSFAIIFMSEESTLSFLLYLMHFENIFRLSPSGKSFFIIIELLAVVLVILRRKSVSIRNLAAITLFLFYSFTVSLFSQNFNFNAFAKFAVSLCLIAVFVGCDWKNNIKSIIGFFCAGIIVASVIALLKDIFPIQGFINIRDLNIAGVSEITDAHRFSALSPDPNYFVVNITCAIIALVYFLVFNMTRKKFLCLLTIAVLFILGLLTFSKSFYLIVVFLYVYFFVTSVVKGKYKFTLALIGVAAVLLLIVLSGKFQTVNLGLKRITTFKDFNDFTTNRIHIWQRYIDYYKDSFFSFAFGDGIGYQIMRVPPHNTYLDMISTFGIVGVVGLIITLTLITASETLKRPLENYFIPVTVVVMYFFLSALTWYDTPFQILIAYFFMNMQLPEQEKISATETLVQLNN